MPFKRSIPILLIFVSVFYVGDVAASMFGRSRLADRTCLAASRRGRRKPSGGVVAKPELINNINPLPPTTSRSIYSLPALYDLAFGYRNYEVEVDFLIAQHQLLNSGKAPANVLELAAGPARHCFEALSSQQTKSATAIDKSPEMVEYARNVAAEELDEETLKSFRYLEGDMRSFETPDVLFDSAWILLGSLQHLTTNSEVISCFESIHKALVPGGTLILELPHPRETFSLMECTRNGWEVPIQDENGDDLGGELKIVWGDNFDEFDPIKQVRQFSVAMELTGVPESDIQSVREVVPLRLFTCQEIDALGRIAGFEIASLHGALADGVDVNDDDEAFRLVCVLRKI
jgi:SAM-dependent methyltransferase